MPSRLIFVGLACVAILLAVYFFVTPYGYRIVQLSEKPPRVASDISLQTKASTLGLDIRLPYQALRTALEGFTEAPYVGEGERRTCEKILFNNVCATLLWNYTIHRSAQVTAEREGSDRVRMTIPLALKGAVGVDGRSARLLGLRNKELSAKLIISVSTKTEMRADWCPVIRSQLSHRWVEEPRLRIAGNLRLNLRKVVDKALIEKLEEIEQQFAELIDCRALRQHLKAHWQTYQMPLELPDQTKAYLSLTPESAYISSSRALESALGISVELNASTQVVADPVEYLPLDFPDLTVPQSSPGTVEFSVLLKLPYDRLSALLSDRLVESQHTENHFSITSVDVYPSGNRLILALGFNARASRFIATDGEVFVSGVPAVNQETRQLKLNDIALTRILDNNLFDLISAVLHQRILRTLQRTAVFNLNRQVKKLEQSIIDTLADPANTGGVEVHAREVEIDVEDIVPEKDGLAVIVSLSARLTATVPAGLLFKRP